MSWATIRSALTSRIAAVTGVENVHGQIRYIDDSVDDSAFETLFKDSDGKLHTWQITRTGVSEVSSPDESSSFAVTHSVRLLGLFMLEDDGSGSTNTEDDFNALIDTLRDEFRGGFTDGDRTLGGASNTYSLPTFDIRHAQYFNFYLVHEAEATFEVEEVVT